MDRVKPEASRDADSGVELAEVVASIALAADLGAGQPLDHVLRSCVIATRFAEHIGLSSEDRDATYWVTLFMVAGCTGSSTELSRFFGDDIGFRADAFAAEASDLAFLRYILSHAGKGRGLIDRARVVAELLRTKMRPLLAAFLEHCAVSAQLA